MKNERKWHCLVNESLTFQPESSCWKPDQRDCKSSSSCKKRIKLIQQLWISFSSFKHFQTWSPSPQNSCLPQHFLHHEAGSDISLFGRSHSEGEFYISVPIMCCLQHFKLKHEQSFGVSALTLSDKNHNFPFVLAAPQTAGTISSKVREMQPASAGQHSSHEKLAHRLSVLTSVDPRNCLQSWPTVLSLSQDCLDKLHECLYKSLSKKNFFLTSLNLIRL